jgi:hypothetical protein
MPWFFSMSDVMTVCFETQIAALQDAASTKMINATQTAKIGLFTEDNSVAKDVASANSRQSHGENATLAIACCTTI